MSTTTTVTPKETRERIAELEDKSRRLDSIVAQTRAQQREMADEVEELQLTLRPEFPTRAQIDGIEVALKRIRDRIGPGHRALEPTGNNTVLVNGKQGLISVQHGAPYSASRGARRWSFTAEDLSAFETLITDAGFNITEKWRHDEGFSLLVKAPAN